MGASTGTGGRCTATTKRGTRCQNATRPGRPFCWFHDPECAEDRHAARARGGAARHARAVVRDGDPAEINDLGDVVDLLTAEINVARSLERSLSRCRAVGYLCNIVAGIYQKAELEERLAAVERKLAGGV